jgi:hypothetical protein
MCDGEQGVWLGGWGGGGVGGVGGGGGGWGGGGGGVLRAVVGCAGVCACCGAADAPRCCCARAAHEPAPRPWNRHSRTPHAHTSATAHARTRARAHSSPRTHPRKLLERAVRLDDRAAHGLVLPPAVIQVVLVRRQLRVYAVQALFVGMVRTRRQARPGCGLRGAHATREGRAGARAGERSPWGGGSVRGPATRWRELRLLRELCVGPGRTACHMPARAPGLSTPAPMHGVCARATPPHPRTHDDTRVFNRARAGAGRCAALSRHPGHHPDTGKQRTHQPLLLRDCAGRLVLRVLGHRAHGRLGPRARRGMLLQLACQRRARAEEPG